MARIRTIKPEFFTSLTIAKLPRDVRLTFIGLWTHVDDEGRCIADPRLIKAAVWPLDDDVTSTDVEQHLGVLTEASLIAQYEVEGRRYLSVSSWSEHQRVNRPTPSKHPPPDDGQNTQIPADTTPSEDSHTTHGTLTEDSLPEGNREQGTGNTSGGAPDGAAPRPKTLVDEHVAACPDRPPSDVIGIVGAKVKRLLEDGIPADDVRGALTLLREKGIHPNALGSLVEEWRATRRRDDVDVADLAERRLAGARSRGASLASGGEDRLSALKLIGLEFHDPALAAAAVEAYDQAAGGAAADA